MSDVKVNKRIQELARRIRPIVDVGGGEFWYILHVGLHDFFLRKATPVRKASGLIAIGSAETLHPWDAPAFFKPTVAQVLEQMPKEYEDQACAFSVHGPQSLDDMKEHGAAFDQSLHVATTLFYARGKPMGWIRHHAIVITTIEDWLIPLKEITDVIFGEGVCTVSEAKMVNGYVTLLVPPDGSKERWPASEAGEDRRARLIDWLCDQEINEDRHYTWVEVEYGETEPRVSRHGGNSG